MRGFSVLATIAVACAGDIAAAAPAAELVVVWAPGQDVKPIANVARIAGAAVLDRSPAPPKPAGIPAVLLRGIEGYDKLRYDDAWKALEEARVLVDRTGAEGLTAAQLSDLFVYRGMLRKERNDPTSFDELVTAIVVDPNRDFDPGRFPPHVIEDLDRARTAVTGAATTTPGDQVGRPRAPLAVDAPAGCTIAIDGASTDVAIPRFTGTHWVRVTCPDHAPWGSRVELTAPSTTIVARPVRLSPPSDTELLIQARTSGGNAVVVAEVRGEVATARLIGIDGRERDRRTVAIRGDLAPLAQAVRELLRPPERGRWYRSRWAWAAGAAILAAAIAIPLTAAATRDSAPASTSIRLPEDFW